MKILSLAATLLISTPVMADQFTDLSTERGAIFNKVISGTASDAEVARFQELTAQIKQLQTSQFTQVETQQEDLKKSMEHIQAQNESIRSSLFGGSQPSNLPRGGSSDAVNNPGSYSSSNRSSSDDSNTPRSNLSGNTTPNQISGAISEVNYQINQIVDKALENNKEYSLLRTRVEHYSHPISRLVANSKETLNYIIPYRGYGLNQEAAKVILDEEVKSNSLASSLYKQQRIVDDLHLDIQTAFVQVAQDGCTEGNSKGYTALLRLVGQEDATKIAQSLLNTEIDPPLQAKLWDVTEMRAKHDELLKIAMDNDAVVNNVMDNVRHYEKRDIPSKVIMPALAVVSLAPDAIGMAARGSLVSWVFMHGGPPDQKLLKELYLDARLESRITMLSSEVDLALWARQLSISSNNGVLAAAATSLVTQMGATKRILE